MKLSTKSRYAARCLIDLAIYGKDHPLSITEIGAREEISERYLDLRNIEKSRVHRKCPGKPGWLSADTSD